MNSCKFRVSDFVMYKDLMYKMAHVKCDNAVRRGVAHTHTAPLPFVHSPTAFRYGQDFSRS